MRIIACLCALIVGSSCAVAAPTDPTTAAIFAGGNLTFGSFSTVTGGPVVANGNVLHQGGMLNVPAMYGGGTFTRQAAAFQTSTGEILFNGDIVDIGGPGSVLGGNVTSGGSISFLSTSTNVQGNVTAAGNVSQPFPFASIQGNVLAGGNVHIAGTVAGNVTYGGAYTADTFAKVGGAVTPGGPVTPPAYQHLTLPAGRNLPAGSNNVVLSSFQDITLAPGAYGTLSYASGNTVTLTSGHYVFGGINSSFSLNELSFDTSGGPIDLYIAGDLDFNVVQVVNGQALFAGGHPNPADSRGIYVEVAGSFTADASLYGTVFAPNGNITLNNFADVTGRLLAGHDVTLHNNDVTVVPEPATLSLLTLGGLAMLRRRR